MCVSHLGMRKENWQRRVVDRQQKGTSEKEEEEEEEEEDCVVGVNRVLLCCVVLVLQSPLCMPLRPVVPLIYSLA